MLKYTIPVAVVPGCRVCSNYDSLSESHGRELALGEALAVSLHWNGSPLPHKLKIFMVDQTQLMPFRCAEGVHTSNYLREGKEVYQDGISHYTLTFYCRGNGCNYKKKGIGHFVIAVYAANDQTCFGWYPWVLELRASRAKCRGNAPPRYGVHLEGAPMPWVPSNYWQGPISAFPTVPMSVRHPSTVPTYLDGGLSLSPVSTSPMNMNFGGLLSPTPNMVLGNITRTPPAPYYTPPPFQGTSVTNEEALSSSGGCGNNDYHNDIDKNMDEEMRSNGIYHSGEPHDKKDTIIDKNIDEEMGSNGIYNSNGIDSDYLDNDYIDIEDLLGDIEEQRSCCIDYSDKKECHPTVVCSGRSELDLLDNMGDDIIEMVEFPEMFESLE